MTSEIFKDEGVLYQLRQAKKDREEGMTTYSDSEEEFAKLLSEVDNDKQRQHVFRRSKAILAHDPISKADGVSDFPGFEFNGYHWIHIGNVIIIYRVDEQLYEVHVDACYFANTGTLHHIFWGIDPDEE